MTGSMADDIEAAKSHLLEAKKKLANEISTYPTPIAGCDAQFNHLLAERRKVQAALVALRTQIHIPTPRAL